MKNSNTLFLIMASLMLLGVAGCPPAGEKLPVCPGEPSLTAAVAAVNARAEAATSIRASGRCNIVFYDDDRRRSESFPAIIRTSPPNNLYFQGNLIVPKSLLLGTNDEFFWLWIRLSEVSSYWTGPVEACPATPALLINPAAVLESLGYVAISPQEAAEYRLTRKPPFDVLTLYSAGRPIKRLHLLACDYTVRRIEYLDFDGRAILTAKLSEYRDLTPGFAVPLRIELAFSDERDRDQSLLIVLNPDTLDVIELTAAQMRALFSRPTPQGAENIYMLKPDCSFVQVPSLP